MKAKPKKLFLQHLKSLFADGSVKITIKSAGGKGPDNIIGGGIGTKNNSGCDHVAVLLDTDIPWPKTLVNEANRKKIKLIGVTPCVEGFMLDILNQKHPTPSNNKTCKAKLHPQLSGKPTVKTSYEVLFTKKVLKDAVGQVVALDEIIKIFMGEFK